MEVDVLGKITVRRCHSGIMRESYDQNFAFSRIYQHSFLGLVPLSTFPMTVRKQSACKFGEPFNGFLLLVKFWLMKHSCRRRTVHCGDMLSRKILPSRVPNFVTSTLSPRRRAVMHSLEFGIDLSKKKMSIKSDSWTL